MCFAILHARPLVHMHIYWLSIITCGADTCHTALHQLATQRLPGYQLDREGQGLCMEGVNPVPTAMSFPKDHMACSISQALGSVRLVWEATGGWLPHPDDEKTKLYPKITELSEPGVQGIPPPQHWHLRND